jgi:hypothetical protein
MNELVLANKFDHQRPRLRAVAYRTLGSVSEAEDAALVVVLSFYLLSAALLGTSARPGNVEVTAGDLSKVRSGLGDDRLETTRGQFGLTNDLLSV